MRTASWVIKEKATGEKTFDRIIVERINRDKYEAVPILDHLASLNQKKGRPIMKPLFKIVDGDENADIYGEASNETEALAIAVECWADPIDRVELYGPIHLSDGTTLDRAFVVFSKQSGGQP